LVSLLRSFEAPFVLVDRGLKTHGYIRVAAMRLQAVTAVLSHGEREEIGALRLWRPAFVVLLVAQALFLDLNHVAHLGLNEFFEGVVADAALGLVVPVIDPAAALKIESQPVQAVQQGPGSNQPNYKDNGVHIARIFK
jgi:hypothetical protein